jgi:uncharacterized LabA/DUF88 family protein
MWVDPVALVRKLLLPSQRLVGVELFTSRIPGARPGEEPHSALRRETARHAQDTYLDALSSVDRLKLHYGYFLDKQRHCLSCGARWMQPEEKKTDVLIACQLLVSAIDAACDQILLISGDSDLSPPLHVIRNRIPAMKLVVAFPPGRRSIDLQRVAHAYLQIGVANIRRSQLPDVVVTPGGARLERPSEWH